MAQRLAAFEHDQRSGGELRRDEAAQRARVYGGVTSGGLDEGVISLQALTGAALKPGAKLPRELPTHELLDGSAARRTAEQYNAERARVAEREKAHADARPLAHASTYFTHLPSVPLLVGDEVGFVHCVTAEECSPFHRVTSRAPPAERRVRSFGPWATRGARRARVA